MRKMGGCGKSEQICDLSDAHLGFLQQVLGAFDALVDHVLMRRVAGRLFEHPQKMILAQTGGARQCAERKIFRKIALYQIQNVLQLFVSQAVNIAALGGHFFRRIFAQKLHGQQIGE